MAKSGRPRGRPRAQHPASNGAPVPISVRVEHPIWAMLAASADSNKRSLNSEVTERLRKSIRPEDRVIEDMVIEGLWWMLGEATPHAVKAILVIHCVRLASGRLEKQQDGRPVFNDGGTAAYLEGLRVAFSDEPPGSLAVPKRGEENRIGRWAGDWVRAGKGPPPIRTSRRVAWPKALGGSWEPAQRHEAGPAQAPVAGKK